MPIVSSGKSEAKKDNASSSKEKQEAKKVFSFVADVPEWNLDEIVLSAETRSMLQDAITFCKKRDTIVDSWGLKTFLKGTGGCTGINMYGKPGTGKTIAAEAIAKAAGKKIIKVDYSEIQSSAWGGTEKQLTELFKTGVETDSVIFFDEADGILGKRQADGANSATDNRIKSHLLTLLDRYNVIVIFATNLFGNYDRAFFRRILFHIHFPLPNDEQLAALWKLHLGDEHDSMRPTIVPRAKDFSFEKAAQDSTELSGGDIKNLTLRACIYMVAKEQPELTNEMLLPMIASYRQSLKDMDTKQSIIKAEVLTGKDREDAKTLFDNPQ